MAMSTEQMNEFLDKGNDALKAGGNSEAPVVSKDVPSESTEVAKTAPSDDVKSAKPAEKPLSKQLSHEDKVSYAFAKEKAKRRAMKTEYEQRIAALEKALGEKHSRADFGDNVDAYMDWKLDASNKEQELSRLKYGLHATEKADVDAENDRRISQSFSKDEDRTEFRQLLESRGPSFLEALTKFDPEGTVLEWLDSKEDYPRVLKALMTDKEALKSVFIHPDAAGRLVALDRLRSKVNTQFNKPKLPKLGRLSKSTEGRSGTRDIEYWNNYLKTHPRGR